MDTQPHAPKPDTAPTVSNSQPLTCAQLFTLFAVMSMVGFGGVMPWTHRMLVEQRHLLTQQEYAELLGSAHLLPGPSVCNLAIIFGYRHAKIRGALWSLAGMILPPVVIVIGLGMLYQHYGSIPAAQSALKGMAIVSAAMIAHMALRVTRTLETNTWNLILAGTTFAGVALLKLPLAPVVAAVISAALLVRKLKVGAK